MKFRKNKQKWRRKLFFSQTCSGDMSLKAIYWKIPSARPCSPKKTGACVREAKNLPELNFGNGEVPVEAEEGEQWTFSFPRIPEIFVRECLILTLPGYHVREMNSVILNLVMSFIFLKKLN